MVTKLSKTTLKHSSYTAKACQLQAPAPTSRMPSTSNSWDVVWVSSVYLQPTAVLIQRLRHVVRRVAYWLARETLWATPIDTRGLRVSVATTTRCHRIT